MSVDDESGEDELISSEEEDDVSGYAMRGAVEAALTTSTTQGVEVNLGPASKTKKGAEARTKKRNQKLQQSGALDSKREKLDKAKVAAFFMYDETALTLYCSMLAR